VDESGAPVPHGEAGNIVYRGPQSMAGYWGNGEATRETLKGGWLHTGDIGRLDEEGFLFVLDRSKDLIKSGGENVYPAEVENVLAAHPAVVDCAVIGLPDAQWGEVVAAVVVARAGTSIELEDLQAFCRGQLAGFKLPRRLHLIDQLPRNAAGKVQKHFLRRDLSHVNVVPTSQKTH
jgi:acyl-CoA synthetase (AMP-forming)/AMP-acid ligase II